MGKLLAPVTAQRGRPLYQTVKEAVCQAIDAGVFSPGDQIPSTKELSGQLGVSLVTMHRALQELVRVGVLVRSQGRGTFVHRRCNERRKIAAALRIGLVFHREASLADFYHGQMLEGVRQSADSGDVDLVMLRFGEDVRNECNGYLLVNPFPDELSHIVADCRCTQPALVVGAQPGTTRLPCFDVDNRQIARLAVRHLAELGHRRIGFVGGAYKISNSRDRWQGFADACRELHLPVHENDWIKGSGWRLSQHELAALAEVLRRGDRPTAVFAAGYRFALDVYATASTVELRIPNDLSVVGVDDPPGAAYLTPPMTTVSQPLVEMGREAMLVLGDHIKNPGVLKSRSFAPELIARQSTAPVKTPS